MPRSVWLPRVQGSVLGWGFSLMPHHRRCHSAHKVQVMILPVTAKCPAGVSTLASECIYITPFYWCRYLWYSQAEVLWECCAHVPMSILKVAAQIVASPSSTCMTLCENLWWLNSASLLKNNRYFVHWCKDKEKKREIKVQAFSWIPLLWKKEMLPLKTMSSLRVEWELGSLSQLF